MPTSLENKEIELLKQAEKSLEELLKMTEVRSYNFPIVKNVLIRVQGLLYCAEKGGR